LHFNGAIWYTYKRLSGRIAKRQTVCKKPSYKVGFVMDKNVFEDVSVADLLRRAVSNNQLLGGLLDMMLPKQKDRSRGGRPRKVNWEESVAKGMVVMKFGVPALGCVCLFQRGVLNFEELSVVMAYIGERLDKLSVLDCFPSSDSWVVGQALKAMGRADVPEVSFDDIVVLGSVVLSQYASDRQGDKQAWFQAWQVWQQQSQVSQPSPASPPPAV